MGAWDNVTVGDLRTDQVTIELASALADQMAAAEVWDQLTDEQHDIYLDWIASAKTAARRSERVKAVVKLLPLLPGITRDGLGPDVDLGITHMH